MVYQNNVKTAIACSFLENDKDSATTAMKLLLEDYKRLLIENATLRSENTFLKSTIADSQDNFLFEAFLPKGNK